VVRRSSWSGLKMKRLLASLFLCCSMSALSGATAFVTSPSHRAAEGSHHAVTTGDTTSGWIPTDAPMPNALPNGLTPSSISLSATSCSSASFCVSVGWVMDDQYDHYPLVETFTNGVWSASIPASPANATSSGLIGELAGVSCPADGICAAVGLYNSHDPQDNTDFQSALLDTLSGGIWSTAEGNVPGGLGPPSVVLSSVSCPSATFCSAAGTVSGNTSVGVVWDWSFGSWAPAELPLPPNFDNSMNVNSISCPDEDDCVAVGWYEDSHFASRPLIETLSSGVWTAADAPVPPNGVAPGVPDGTPSVALFGLDCPSVDYCIAGGQYTQTSQVMAPLLEVLQSGTWTPLEGPVPPDATGYAAATVEAVTCPAGGACIATGQYGGSSGYTGMILTQSGSGWSAVDAPIAPPNTLMARRIGEKAVVDADVSTSSTLSGVGCSAVGPCASSGADGSDGLLETEQITGLPYVTNISPSSGAAGTTVTITGANFAPGSAVDFGGVASTGVSYVDSSEVQATVPTGLACGTSALSVTSNGLITHGTAGDLFSVSTPCAPHGFSIVTSGLSPAHVGSKYSVTLVANGGVGALKWKLTAGSLPKQLKLSATGVISGTIASGKHGAAPGNYQFTVTVTDRKKPLRDSASSSFTLTLLG
jgi:hypothetical protein